MEVNVHVDVDAPFEGGVTGLGLQPVRLTPVGDEAAVNVTLLVNPLTLVIVTVEAPLAPVLKLTGLVAEIVKS